MNFRERLKLEQPVWPIDEQHDTEQQPANQQPAGEHWREDFEVYLRFRDDPDREEIAIEITNLDHSETYGYLFPGFAAKAVRAVNEREELLAVLGDLVAAAKALDDGLHAGLDPRGLSVEQSVLNMAINSARATLQRAEQEGG